MVVGYAQSADFTVRGVVKLSQLAGHQQQIEIHWLVYDRGGKEAGDVAQGHDIEQGSLDHMWGDVAAAVATRGGGRRARCDYELVWAAAGVGAGRGWWGGEGQGLCPWTPLGPRAPNLLH